MSQQIGFLAIQCTASNGEVGTYLYSGDHPRTGELLTAVYVDSVDLYRFINSSGWVELPYDCAHPCGVYTKASPAIIPLGGNYVALPDGGVEWVADVSPAMVAQPVQQQQARARAARPVRGERRVVTVRASDTGETFNVLTSVAGSGFAMIEDIPSNEHRAGELRGMLLTHGAIRKAVVFASMEEGAAYAEQSRRKGWGHRYNPAAIVADPAAV